MRNPVILFTLLIIGRDFSFAVGGMLLLKYLGDVLPGLGSRSMPAAATGCAPLLGRPYFEIVSRDDNTDRNEYAL